MNNLLQEYSSVVKDDKIYFRDINNNQDYIYLSQAIRFPKNDTVKEKVKGLGKVKYAFYCLGDGHYYNLLKSNPKDINNQKIYWGEKSEYVNSNGKLQVGSKVFNVSIRFSNHKCINLPKTPVISFVFLEGNFHDKTTVDFSKHHKDGYFEYVNGVDFNKGNSLEEIVNFIAGIKQLFNSKKPVTLQKLEKFIGNDIEDTVTNPQNDNKYSYLLQYSDALLNQDFDSIPQEYWSLLSRNANVYQMFIENLRSYEKQEKFKVAIKKLLSRYKMLKAKEKHAKDLGVNVDDIVNPRQAKIDTYNQACEVIKDFIGNEDVSQRFYTLDDWCYIFNASGLKSYYRGALGNMTKQYVASILDKFMEDNPEYGVIYTKDRNRDAFDGANLIHAIYGDEQVKKNIDDWVTFFQEQWPREEKLNKQFVVALIKRIEKYYNDVANPIITESSNGLLYNIMIKKIIKEFIEILSDKNKGTN